MAKCTTAFFFSVWRITSRTHKHSYLDDHFPSDSVCQLVNNLSVKTSICIYVSKHHRKWLTNNHKCTVNTSCIAKKVQNIWLGIMYRKHLCISRTFLLKFWAKNRECGLYTRQLLSEGVKGLGRGHKLNWKPSVNKD